MTTTTVKLHEKKLSIINKIIQHQNQQLINAISIKENIDINTLNELLNEFNSTHSTVITR
jgi:hypothetical protein